jgi:iron complex transport system ATP-binding protein
MILAEGLSFEYGADFHLEEIGFRIPAGGFWGIVGPNGSGKSTLLKILSRVLIPARGSVQIEATPLKDISIQALARRVAFVGSEAHFAFPFRVWEVVLMGRIPFVGRLASYSKDDQEKARAALRKTEAWELRDRYITDLSSGERQRILLARALAQEPKVLMLDEPTAHLDLHYEIEIFNILKTLNATSHLTILAVSHNLNLMAEFCDTLMVLNSGRCHRIGQPTEILTSELLREVFRIECTIAPNPYSKAPTILINTTGN